MNSDVLAYYYYPSVGNHDFMEYSKEDLMNEKTLETIFDYAQILEAYITPKGWDFLIQYYGYDKLFQIDKRSGWFDEDTIYEYIERVNLEKNI